MSLEIERKFLVKEIPTGPTCNKTSFICQGYLKTGIDYEVRVSSGLHLTTKSGFGLTRTENIYDISKEVFDALWPLTLGKRIEKERRFYRVGKYTAELDIYHGANEGVVVVEVEFPSEEEANKFLPPPWFGKDITYEIGYKNSILAK